MGIKIRVELSERERRFVRASLVVAVTAVVVGGIGLASAAPINTSWIGSNQPIPAASLKANLDGLQAQVDKPTVSKNGKQYSLGATYCGKTAPTNGQITNRYAGAKGLCEAVAACGASPSAHMCTAEEIDRSAQMGVAIDSGWFSAATHSTWFGCGGGTCASSQTSADCDGWSVTFGDYYGMAWQSGGYVRQATCNTSQPVLCCD